MKTIFFVIATRPRVNFILRTDTYRLLKERGYRLVIFSPFSQDLDFQKEFGGVNVVFEPLCPLGKIGNLLNNYRNEALLFRHPTLKLAKFIHKVITRRYQTAENFWQKAKKILKQPFLWLVWLCRSEKFWNSLEDIFISECCDYFKKYQPSAVVLATAGAEGQDVPFLIAARRFGVPAAAIDNNIDVFEFRYFSQPRKIAQWALFGEVHKQEAMAVQGLPADILSVTGPARYDHHFNFQPIPREEFFRKIGADPSKKLITYGAKIPKMYPHNADVLEIILQGVDAGKFGPAQLFVRFDPGHDPSQYGNLLNKIIWEKADEQSHREHVANLLYHSDVVISIGSTFCCEAVLLDRPSLWVGFDGYKTYSDPKESYGYIYNLPMFQIIDAIGGIPLVKSPAELVGWISKYLKNPKLDSEKRAALVRQEYYKNDGQAGKRVADLIESLMQ